ncbi:MAG TPA: hypothetical protein VM681_05185 [Candidatus Thermoplasmatota archaeon]|nr:hypothetical protein [Candidatus Thermoplasmatota archaeon]
MLTRTAFGLAAAGFVLSLASGALGALLILAALVALGLGRREHGEDHELLVMGAVPIVLLGFLVFSFPEPLASMLVGLTAPFTSASAKAPAIAWWSLLLTGLGFLALCVGWAVALWDRAGPAGRALAVAAAVLALLLPAVLHLNAAVAGPASGFNEGLAEGRHNFSIPWPVLTLASVAGGKIVLALALAATALRAYGVRRDLGAHLA